MGTTVEFPWLKQLSSDIYFSADQFVPGLKFYSHSHPWGQFVYVAEGLMYFKVEGQAFIAGPSYGIWIPPNFEHSAQSAATARFLPIHFSIKLSEQLPSDTCVLQVSPILRSIIEDFANRDICVPESAEDIKLADVAVDQLRQAPKQKNYLPYATSKELQKILEKLQENPGDDRSVAEWAEYINTTGRTLQRRCLCELGLTLVEWRQRLRFLRAVEALTAGETIQQIAFELGYSTPSAFVAMFHRMSGKTPGQYRSSHK
jgi:AraC-like DNA-binding protein